MRSAARCSEPAAGGRPAPRSPRRGRSRSRSRSRDPAGDREAPLAAPLVRAARRRRRPCPRGLRSPLPRRPGSFLICMGPAEFRFRQEPAPLSPPSRWARPSSPRSHGAALSPAHTRPDVAPRSGAEPPGAGAGGGRCPGGAGRASAAHPGARRGPRRRAPLPPGAGSRWRRWVRRGVPAALALPRRLVTLPAAHAVAFICLGRGPRQPIAPGERKEAVAAPCKSILAALICRRQKA